MVVTTRVYQEPASVWDRLGMKTPMTNDDETAKRKRDSGLGYPEEGKPGDGIDPREHAEDDAVPDHDDAPRTSGSDDGDASQATGNPDAAGGDG
jgi:hypothetical protein